MTAHSAARATVRFGRFLGGALMLAGLAGTASAQQTVTPPATALSAAERAAAFTPLALPYKQETIELKLAPGEGMEYKYRIEKGGALLFSWTSTAAVHYELHSEPDGAPRGFAEFFDQKDDALEAHGIYDALFPGIHGWYWENKTPRELSITLKSAGAYQESREYRKGTEVKIKRFE